MQALSFLLYPFHKVKRTFQTLFLYLRPTWIELAHGGVDPIFQRALDTCVPLTMEHNLAVIATIEEPKNLADSFLNYLVLLTQLRTRRLVRFTQYHSDELNKGHKRSLKKIYKHIGMIQSLRSNALAYNPCDSNADRSMRSRIKQPLRWQTCTRPPESTLICLSHLHAIQIAVDS